MVRQQHGAQLKMNSMKHYFHFPVHVSFRHAVSAPQSAISACTCRLLLPQRCFSAVRVSVSDSDRRLPWGISVSLPRQNCRQAFFIFYRDDLPSANNKRFKSSMPHSRVSSAIGETAGRAGSWQPAGRSASPEYNPCRPRRHVQPGRPAQPPRPEIFPQPCRYIHKEPRRLGVQPAGFSSRQNSKSSFVFFLSRLNVQSAIFFRYKRRSLIAAVFSPVFHQNGPGKLIGLIFKSVHVGLCLRPEITASAVMQQMMHFVIKCEALPEAGQFAVKVNTAAFQFAARICKAPHAWPH